MRRTPPPRLTPDPGDDYLVALAFASRDHALASGDRHLLGLSLRSLTVLSPRELWERLRPRRE